MKINNENDIEDATFEHGDISHITDFCGAEMNVILDLSSYDDNSCSALLMIIVTKKIAYSQHIIQLIID